MDLEHFIRDVPDFPKKGIVFKDITPLLADAAALGLAIESMARHAANHDVQKVAGIESRGFIFGTAVAKELGLGFIPIRKPGKLPWKKNRVEYELEYGTDAVEMHEDAVQPGERVMLVDDLLATGGTLAASAELIESAGGVVVACSVLIELAFLEGRKAVDGRSVFSLLSYE